MKHVYKSFFLDLVYLHLTAHLVHVNMLVYMYIIYKLMNFS